MLRRSEAEPHAPSSHRHCRQMFLSLLLYALLVHVHATLFNVWSHRYAPNLVFPFNTLSSQWLLMVVTFVSQTVGVVSAHHVSALTQLRGLLHDIIPGPVRSAVSTVLVDISICYLNDSPRYRVLYDNCTSRDRKHSCTYCPNSP